MTPAVMEYLKEAARRTCWDELEDGSQDENFCVFDCSGSNVDDAYEGGVRDGETLLAREVLKAMAVSWQLDD